MDNFVRFTRQQYFNLETFRKSGVGVKTPVWFVKDGDTLFVRTIGSSGKVKRIRNNSTVNIAPCKMDGTLVGDWMPAIAHEVKEQEIDRKVDRLLDEKYGLMKRMFAVTSALLGRKYTVLEIREKI